MSDHVKPMHMTRNRIAVDAWRCADCGKTGTIDELNAVGCPDARVGPLTSEEQIREWVAGRPTCPNDDGECCPDFSCCHPDMLSPREEREAYARKRGIL